MAIVNRGGRVAEGDLKGKGGIVGMIVWYSINKVIYSDAYYISLINHYYSITFLSSDSRSLRNEIEFIN